MEPVDMVTESDFDAFLSENEKAVVVFKGQWCAGCEQMVPVARQLASEGIAVALVDVGVLPTVAGRFGVMSIPSTLVFREGEELARFVGVVGPEEIREHLK